MNIQHMKHAVTVAAQGSLGKASEILLIAVPNISRSIKELEADLGITIFERTPKGMELTPDGEEFIAFAKDILSQIEQVEDFYKKGSPQKQKFSISVPRACYISEAFARFTKYLTKEPAELFYEETNSRRAIENIEKNDYKLGIIRYAKSYDEYFAKLLDEKGLCHEQVTEFTYSLIMSENSPLAQKETLTFSDLTNYIEVAHADPFLPSVPLSKVIKEETSETIARRIFIFERASQFDLLSQNPETFMWVSLAPNELLERFHLVQRKCLDNSKAYKDVLIYKNGYQLTALDREFITELVQSKRKYSPK